MTREIPLTRGYVALVDDEDYERVAALKWQAAVRPRKCGYPQVYASHGRGRRRYMHQFILGISGVDHANRNGLDNRRANLRPATQCQQGYNTARISRKTGFRGVGRQTLAPTFHAIIRVNGRSLYLGTFPTAVEAAIAYDEAAKQYHGPFAILNFPDRRSAEAA